MLPLFLFYSALADLLSIDWAHANNIKYITIKLFYIFGLKSFKTNLMWFGLGDEVAAA